MIVRQIFYVDIVLEWLNLCEVKFCSQVPLDTGIPLVCLQCVRNIELELYFFSQKRLTGTKLQNRKNDKLLIFKTRTTPVSLTEGAQYSDFQKKTSVEKACRLTGDLCTNSWISNRPPRNLKPIHHNDYNMCITNTSNLGCPSTPKRNTKILVAQNKPQTDSRSIMYPTNADELVP